MSTATAAPVASAPIVRALVERARAKNYTHGVIGVRAEPTWAGPDVLAHDGGDIAVVACPSALAVREALLTRSAHPWLIVLTDRDEEDLGVGIRTRLIEQRLLSADPWEAVRRAFGAHGVESALASGREHREIAAGLLALQPPAGWPPARGGLLTRDHAFACLARAHLGMAATDPDARAVLTWSTDPAATTRIGELRRAGGHALTDAALRWLARRCGNAADPVAHLGAEARLADAVPLGLAVGVLSTVRDGAGRDSAARDSAARDSAARDSAARDGAAARGDDGAAHRAGMALVRLERWTSGALDPHVAAAWATEAADTASALLAEETGQAAAHRCLHRADTLLTEVHADGLSGVSDLLPSALTARLADLADTLRAAFPGTAAQPARLPGELLAGVEQRWAPVRVHRLRDTDPRIRAFAAAVRLSRWLALPDEEAAALPEAAARHRDVDAWVDSAINDAAAGVTDPELSAGLQAVLAAARARRARHDEQFAQALSRWSSADPPAPTDFGLWPLEDVLTQVVIPAVGDPAAGGPGVLFLILDGMSCGVGVEVIDNVLAHPTQGWIEVLLPGQTRRAGGIAALPTLTEVSRTCLLCGELRVGGQDTERAGFDERTRAHRLDGSVLFHKKPLDSSRLGYAVADDVRAAIRDVAGRPLVTCVLNTIDDALDRDDPGGIEWGIDAVKHLAPLLDLAHVAGRTVILTGDHGHVVERRLGRQQPQPVTSSGRSRAADPPPGAGEVRVRGRRVLKHDGDAVLAVDEALRYGPLKAGYHGGAAPAEVIVPLAVLVPGALPEGSEFTEAPPQNPGWWITPWVPAGPASASVAAQQVRPPSGAPPTGTEQRPTLFDDPDPLVAAMLASPMYAEMRAIAGRVSVTEDQMRRLLAALLRDPQRRVDAVPGAQALGVPTARLPGAVAQVIKLLNVEGYPVLGWDADGATLVLDEALLREQFEIGR